MSAAVNRVVGYSELDCPGNSTFRPWLALLKIDQRL
jgi:hypothetical protein